MKHFLCCLALLCLFCSATAQSKPPSESLSIGDQVPDIALSNIINHPTGKARLSDYQGKLLILDFWATWCSPCIKSIPKTDSLRKAFNGKLEILSVTYQSKAEVDKLFARASLLKGITVPMVVEDKQLHELFPHSGLPHYVWINQKGKVIAITDLSEVTAANISKAISESPASLIEKRDVQVLPYDRLTPLMFNPVEITPEDLDFEVIHMGYKPGFASRLDLIRYPDNTIARISITNCPLKDLYMLAFSSDKLLISNSRLITESNSETFKDFDFKGKTPQQIMEFQNKELHCFELIVPNRISASTFQIMQKELLQLFPQFRVALETRTVDCISLERISKVDKLKTKGGKPKATFDQFETTIVNGSVDFLVANLGATPLQHLKTPLVNNTAYEGKIDIALAGNQTSVENLKAQLHRYDLDLLYKKMPVTMLVIADAN